MIGQRDTVVSYFYKCNKVKGQVAELHIRDGMKASAHADTYASNDILNLTLHLHRDVRRVKRWRHGNSICVTGTWRWGILSGQSKGGPLRSERRGMPMGLTGWPTSVPSAVK